jgi:H+-transporting ATPase
MSTDASGTMKESDRRSRSSIEGISGLVDEVDTFEYNHVGLTSAEASALLLKWGKNELPEEIIPLWYIYVQQLWQPMPLMIWLACIVELAIESYLDFGILLTIQFANATIGFYEITKSGNAIAALKNSVKPTAYVKRDGRFQNIDASYLVPGDLVSLANGAAIPADCRVNEGTFEVDQAQLTGESLPVVMYKGDSVKWGSTVVRGEVECTVQYTGKDTFLGTTAALLKDDGEHSNLNKLLISIIIILTVVSSVLCLIVFIYLTVLHGVKESLQFTVVLMVASIPLAIEIVTTTTLALGSKELVAHGAIVRKLASIEDMAGMSILCSDKTGTLTLGKMVIQDETPVYTKGETQYSILRYAAMATKWKDPPRDALDTLTLGCADLASLNDVEQTDFMPFDPTIKRTEGTVIEKGKKYRITKGAPHIILALCEDKSISDSVNKDVANLGERGIRAIAVAKCIDNKWAMLGLLTFLDPPRLDTKETIERAISFGVCVKMITGDHLLIAKETAKQLNMGSRISDASQLPMLDSITKEKPANLGGDYGPMCLVSDGFAQVFPEHKYLIIEALRELGYKVAMTGDGVNDAPALKRADVGIAVMGATDAAQAASDIVLTQEGLSTIITGILVARKIFARIRNFITYRVAATLQLLIFFFVAVFALEPEKFMPDGWESMPDFDKHAWPEYFHMPVLMLMLITLLNDGTLIAIGYDNVVPSLEPDKWNLKVLFVVGSVLAGVAFISSISLLAILLDSWNEDGVFQQWGGVDRGLSYGQVTTSIYLKVSISDFLTLFSARTGDDWFWSSKPSPILMGAAATALTLSTVLALSWPETYPDDVLVEGLGRRGPYGLWFWIWLYCIIWWFIQDACKVGAWAYMKKTNMFGINDTGKVKMDAKTREQGESKLASSGY